MSDTTTITQEERAYWRRIIDEDCLVGDNAKIWRLLDALEQAEARAEKAEAENARLRAQNNALLECRKAEKSLAALTRINDGIKGGWSKPWEHEGLPKKLRKARERVKIARQLLETASRAVADAEREVEG